jgi:class 3 adenylate cyclase
MATCERCNSESPGGFRFCGVCGAPLPVVAARREARKLVTVLFCDVTGSTALGEELDPEALRDVMKRYFAVMRGTIERHGGTVEKFIGDAVMAVFGIPRVHEDDAVRAVRAAAEIRERLPAVAEEVGVALRLRTGVNTGTVVTGEGETLATGDAVNVAARLEQAARPGEILLGPETLRQVRDAVEGQRLEPIAVKGKSEPVPVFRLLRVDPIAPGLARRLDVPLVGRRSELRHLYQAWARTVDESDCRLCTVLGVAGVGKSRLVAELLADVGEAATALSGRCLQYGEGITFWPLMEALRPVGERARPVLELLSTGGAATPEELFLAVRRLLESLAVDRPVILHVDDLQWAEPMLFDLLDHIGDRSQGAPILLLCTARPWLLEDRPGWGAGKPNATTVRLAPLPIESCEALLDQLGDGLGPETRARVVVASEGNPLFLEEMVALVHERGTVAVPSTIQALLAARLERLVRDDREVLERGAVEGDVFHRLGIRALVSEHLASDVGSRIAGLVRQDLVRPHPATVRGDDAFRFRHLLIRDVAYEGLPKGARADLHARFGRWLLRNAGGLVELDEIAGWHLEQAVRYRRALGLAVEPDLARQAAGHLYSAGRRARERSDAAAARNLLERALALVPEADPLRLRIGVDLAEQLMEAGELARADELLAASERDPDAARLAVLNRFEWLIRVHPEKATQTIESRLPGILAQLARTGDERGIAKAHMAAFWVHMLQSRPTPAGQEARLAAEHARNAGDQGLRSWALGWYIVTLVYGRQHAREIGEELDAIEREDIGPYLAARVAFGRGELARLEGRFGDARELTQRAIEGFEALGLPAMEACGQQELARTELSAGNPAAAIASLVRSDAILAELGARLYRALTQALLAQAYERAGNRAAARRAVELAEELSLPEDVLNYAITHGVRARLALGDGDGDAAERWARSAASFLTDYLGFQAKAKLELARILLTLGRRQDATSEAQAALDSFLAKGDVPGADQTRALLDELVVSA